jgi:CBS domain containing-hemolysin-like protein
MDPKKHKTLRFLKSLKRNEKRLIITILLGNNVVNILIPVLATLWATDRFGSSAIGVVTGILTLVLLLFGEILPKNLAITYNKQFSLFVAPIIYLFEKLFFPLVWILEKFSDLFTSDKGALKKVTEEEVLAMVSIGEEHGEITAEEKDRIENLLEISETAVKDIMTPRPKLDVLSDQATLGEAKAFVLGQSHTRIPVYSEDIDHVTDILTLRDVLEASLTCSDDKLLKNLELRSPYFVPVTKKVNDLFHDFQRQNQHIAIVVDEHGGTAGLVTMEDIIEEIFGEIRDESDDEKAIEVVNEGTWTLDPSATVEEVFDKTGFLVSENDEDKEKSLSLLILEKLERFPRRGETVEFESVALVIEKVGENKVIESVRMFEV